MDRKSRVKHYIEQVSKGVPLDKVRAEFRRDFEGVPAEEIAEAERMLMEEGMPLHEVQQLCDVHAALFEGAVLQDDSQEPPGHPLYIFSKENEGLRRLVDDILKPAYEAWQQQPDGDRSALQQALSRLQAVDKHYSRKENLFFPYLERAGVTAPPKVMWGVDDEIRALIKALDAAVADNEPAEASKLYPQMLDKLLSMITKEEEILKPLLRQHMNQADWQVVAGESGQIGYAFVAAVEGASPSDAQAWLKEGSAATLPRTVGAIQLPSGFFEVEELRVLLNSLPCDVTFVGADDKVHFFSEQKERVFPRTRTIIGRGVADCHPPKSLDAVDALIRAFKEGRKDSESYWIQKGDKFILIRYYALRDDQGKYLGTLECTEEISGLRALSGEKTLMSQ